MKVKKLPMILALHLKRFKYMDQLHRYTKLSYRVVFPLELRLFNTSGDATNPDRMYDLVAVVVHCGRCAPRGEGGVEGWRAVWGCWLAGGAQGLPGQLGGRLVTGSQPPCFSRKIPLF